MIDWFQYFIGPAHRRPAHLIISARAEILKKIYSEHSKFQRFRNTDVALEIKCCIVLLIFLGDVCTSYIELLLCRSTWVFIVIYTVLKINLLLLLLFALRTESLRIFSFVLYKVTWFFSDKVHRICLSQILKCAWNFKNTWFIKKKWMYLYITQEKNLIINCNREQKLCKKVSFMSFYETKEIPIFDSAIVSIEESSQSPILLSHN